MDMLEKFLVAGADPVVVDFVGQMYPVKNDSAVIAQRAPKPIEEVCEADEGEDEEEEPFSDMIMEARESVGYASDLVPYIEAIFYSLDDDGMLSEPLGMVQQYCEKMGVALRLEKLDEVRIRLRDEGPVLGMGSRDYREYRYVVANHLLKKKTGEAESVRYTLKLHRAIRELKRLEADGLCLRMLFNLARLLHYSDKQARSLKVSMVMNLVACDEAQARLLHEAYEFLPLAPRGK